MDPKMIIAAVPWLRRAWRLLPMPLRLPVFAIAAAVGLFFAVTGREELKHAIREMREGGGAQTIDQRSGAQRSGTR